MRYWLVVGLCAVTIVSDSFLAGWSLLLVLADVGLV